MGERASWVARTFARHYRHLGPVGAVCLLSQKPGGGERWQVRAVSGRYVMGRLPAGVDLSHLAAQLAAMGAGWRWGLAVPRPVPTHRGQAWVEDEDQVVYALTWVSGRPHVRWESLPLEAMRRLGEEVARLHAALRSLPPDVGGDRGFPPQRRGEPHDQVLHGDLTPGNVLWRRHGVGMVDFERTRRGPVELDLALALVSLPPWAREGPCAHALAFLEGYGPWDPGRLEASLREAAVEGRKWLEETPLAPARRRAEEAWLRRVEALAPQGLRVLQG